MAHTRIIIICGEASGDLNAAGLIKAIKLLRPDIEVSGVGGELLREAGAKIFYDIKELSVIGLFDVLKKLPKFFALKKLILHKIETEKPDCVIMVDFSGFNLRLAKTLNNAAPVIYYVSPQVWASRQGRIKTLKRYIVKIIVLFKFEEEFYKKCGIRAAFVGHPLLDVVKPAAEKKEFLRAWGLDEAKRTIVLLPGSRNQEVRYILPIMLEASAEISNTIPQVQFIIAKSPQVDARIYDGIITRGKIKAKIIEGKTYDCLNSADFALVASGMATLETAIMEVPFVLLYKMNILNYVLYRPQVKVPFIGMVNIVAGRKIVPEFIQFRACPTQIAKEVTSLLTHPAEIERMKQNLAGVKSLLGEKGASLRAAKIILEFLKDNATAKPIASPTSLYP